LKSIIIKLTILLLIISAFAPNLYSQNSTPTDTTSNWKRGGFFGINFNQLSLSNWARGGESSYATTGLFNYFFNYTDSSGLKWDNTLDMGYGIINNEESGVRKNEDKIDYITSLGYRALENQEIYYSALLNFKSQFYRGYNYPNDSLVISNFFAPAFLTVGLGMEYKYQNILSIIVSPVTGRLIFINDDDIANAGLYGNEKPVYDSSGVMTKKAEKLIASLGVQVTTQLRYDIWENVSVISRLDLFNNYTDKNIRNRQNIDVNSETTIIMKINKFLAANIFLQFIYDDDTKVPIYEKVDGLKTKIGEGKRLQIKQVLGVGLSVKF
jgi:hypothetical protein